MKREKLSIEDLEQITGGSGAGPLSASVSNMQDNSRLRSTDTYYY